MWQEPLKQRGICRCRGPSASWSPRSVRFLSAGAECCTDTQVWQHQAGFPTRSAVAAARSLLYEFEKHFLRLHAEDGLRFTLNKCLKSDGRCGKNLVGF